MRTEQERQRSIEHAQRSLQREIDRNIFMQVAITNGIDVDKVLYELHKAWHEYDSHAI